VGRDVLIDSTRRLLQIKPPGKVTRDEIARFAGVNPALIRYYFLDKSNLLTAVVEAISKDNLKRLRETLNQEGTAADRLARRVHLLLQMHAENPYYHQLIFEQLGQESSRKQRRLAREMIVPYFEEFHRLFSEGRRRGEMRDVDPRFLHVALIGLCELFMNAPYMLRELFQVKAITPQLVREYGDFVVDLLLHGVGPNSQGDRSR
jgi:AcrR family transcriptional regulator